jgi:hypothetical protein
VTNNDAILIEIALGSLLLATGKVFCILIGYLCLVTAVAKSWDGSSLQFHWRHHRSIRALKRSARKHP